MTADATVSDEGGWRPVLQRRQFRLQIFTRAFLLKNTNPVPGFGYPGFAIGIALTDDIKQTPILIGESYAIQFPTEEGLRQFCRDMIPRQVLVCGVDAEDRSAYYNLVPTESELRRADKFVELIKAFAKGLGNG